MINLTNSYSTPVDAAKLVAGLSLSGADASVVARHLEAVLVAPVRDLMSRPHKSIRAKLVAVGYRLGREVLLARGSAIAESAEWANCLTRIGEAVELLHGGSLIVDDVQDQSMHRRGKPSIHRIYGEANAIATGNWLYFYPFEMIRALPISRSLADRMCAAFEQNIARAHYGQALDVGVRADAVDQSEVEALSRSIMDFKTGSLTALGLTLGGQFAGLSEEDCEALSQCGRGMGVALQMFDDIGNLTSRKDPEKSLEDLTNRRLSWVWGFAARSLSPQDYEAFLACVRKLPDQTGLWEFLERTDFVARAAEMARCELTSALTTPWAAFPELKEKSSAVAELKHLGESLIHAF